MLHLNIRFRMNSDDSLSITGQLLLPFLLGRANTLVTRRWKGRLVEGGRSPHAVAESRQGLMISLRTRSGIAVEGVVEVMGRPRMRREVARVCK